MVTKSVFDGPESKNPQRIRKKYGNRERSTISFWIWITVFNLCLYCGDGARTGRPLVEFSGRHIAGGLLQSNLRDEHSCKSQCVSLDWCLALDFDYSTLTCWFHGLNSVCSPLQVLPGAKHFKHVECPGVPQTTPTGITGLAVTALQNVNEQFRNAHTIGGTRMPAVYTWIDCILACSGNCRAVDFDNNDNSCWHHYGLRGCDAPNAHRSGSYHYRMKGCERAINDPANVLPQIARLPPVTPVIERPPTGLVLKAPGVTTCGRPAVPPSGSRIIGGDESRAHSWPWQVALRNINARSSRCAGTLVAPQWVLTTAHCVDQDQQPSNWFVLAGAHDLLTLEADRAVHAVSRIIIHERFDLNTFDNDIAMLRLTVPVRFSPHISPVCMPPPNSILAPGTQCIIAGWGVAANGRRPLKQATVPVVDLNKCRRPDWLGSEFTLTDNMMCAGYEHGGVDTCQGDSGGPLVCYVNNHWIQAGVTSFGRGCGMPRKPGVYTLVSKFVSWIQKVINIY